MGCCPSTGPPGPTPVRSRRADDDDDHDGNGHQRRPDHRRYEVQNGNHIETYEDTFSQLELIEPHAQRAFDLLVDRVENRAA